MYGSDGRERSTNALSERTPVRTVDNVYVTKSNALSERTPGRTVDNVYVSVMSESMTVEGSFDILLG